MSTALFAGFFMWIVAPLILAIVFASSEQHPESALGMFTLVFVLSAILFPGVGLILYIIGKVLYILGSFMLAPFLFLIN